MTKVIIATALFIVSISTAVFSALLSFTGLGNAFPGIPFVGGIGAVIALTTVAISAATSQARKQHQFGLFKVCVVLMVAAMALDFGANTTATTGEVSARSVQYEQALNAYNVARTTLAETRERIEKAETDLETVIGSDVEAAQLVLVSYGERIKVDGKRGPKTNAALASFGQKLRTDLVEMRKSETAAANTVAAGLPENSGQGDLAFALLLAAMLTILSASMSFIASALLGGDEIDLDELETAIDQGLEGVSRLEDWLDKAA